MPYRRECYPCVFKIAADTATSTEYQSNGLRDSRKRKLSAADVGPLT